MILKEFTTHNPSRLQKLTTALNENYDYDINFDDMTTTRAARMIDKATKRLNESKDSNQRVKLALIVESLTLWHKSAIQSELTEGLGDDEMESAKVILAAKELSDKIQGMIEDAAKMQVQDLLPIVDAMKSEIGTAEADTFSSTADAALGGLVDSLKATKSEFDNAIAAAQGEQVGTDMDGFGGDEGELGMDDMEGDLDAVDVDMSAMDDEGDEFGGDDTEIGGEMPSGREMKAEI